MATLYENYNTGGDSADVTWGSRWRAQTFTPSTAHTLKSIKLFLARVGSPGTFVVSIRATDANGQPSGSDLVSGSSNGNTLPLVSGTSWSSFEWREITFGTGMDLVASTKYAIVLRFPSGDADTNFGRWQEDSSSPSYSGGYLIRSLDSGATWTDVTTADMLFEEYGADLPTVTTEAATAITGTTATGHGTIVDLGGSAVTEHGHCWSLTINPTTADSKTTKGAGSLGTFTSSITGLIGGLKYYFRAYATNTGGTAYGGNISFISGNIASMLSDGNLTVKGTTVHYVGFDGIEYYIQGTAV